MLIPFAKAGAVILLLVSGCSESPSHRRYAAIAAKINPVIVELRPLATWMLAPPSRSDAEVAARCKSEDHVIDQLADVDAPSGVISIGKAVFLLQQDRKASCLTSTDDWATTRCATFCRWEWRYLAERVNLAAKQAREAGVTINTLYEFQ